MNAFSTVQTASNACSRWPATNTRMLPFPHRANPASYRVPTSPKSYRLGVWEVPGIIKVAPLSHELRQSSMQSALSGPACHQGVRAHPKPPRTPPRRRSQASARMRRTSRCGSLVRELPPLRPYLRRQAVVLPPINTLLPQPTAPSSDYAPPTPTETEPATLPNPGHEALMLAADSGFIRKDRLPPTQHTQTWLEDAATSTGMKRKRTLAQTSDATSTTSINSDEYAPLWQNDTRAHSGTRTRRLKFGRQGKRKGYGYCHYVADDYTLREACAWVPPHEIRDERSEGEWFRFAERILDWRDRAMKDQGTREEQEIAWYCGDVPSELRVKQMCSNKPASQTDELESDDSQVARNSKRRRG